MYGEGGFVQIAFELEARLLDKRLILRLPGDWRQLASGVEGSNPFQVDVQESVGAGEQAGRFGRSVLAQGDDQRHGRSNHQNSEHEGKAASDAHRVWAGRALLGGETRRVQVW